MDSSLELPEGTNSANALILVLFGPIFQTSYLQNSKTMYLCCFMPLILWQIVTAVIGNSYTRSKSSLPIIVKSPQPTRSKTRFLATLTESRVRNVLLTEMWHVTPRPLSPGPREVLPERILIKGRTLSPQPCLQTLLLL